MASQGWHPIVMVYVDWPSGAVRVHSNVGTVSFGGHSWVGIGDYGRVEVPDEDRSGGARHAVLTLLGPADGLLGRAREAARGRAGEVWFGAVTERSGSVLVSDPVRIFRGTVDAIAFQLRSEDASGKIKVEAGLQVELVSGPALRRNASIVHSLEDHKARWSATDTAGRLIQAAMRNARVLTWPE